MITTPLHCARKSVPVEPRNYCSSKPVVDVSKERYLGLSGWQHKQSNTFCRLNNDCHITEPLPRNMIDTILPFCWRIIWPFFFSHQLQYNVMRLKKYGHIVLNRRISFNCSLLSPPDKNEDAAVLEIFPTGHGKQVSVCCVQLKSCWMFSFWISMG